MYNLEKEKVMSLKYSSEKFYNIFAPLYPLVDIFLKAQKKRLFQEINDLTEGRVLEIGVGNGTHLPLYTKHKVVAIDTSSKMLEIAKRHKGENIELIEMSGEELLFEDEVFNYIVLSHVISVVPNGEKLMQEVNRVLKPNGKLFILNHFTPNNPLKYIDRAFHPLSKFFHFKSFFTLNEIKEVEKFKLLKSIEFGLFSYYKLMVYQK